KRFFRLCTRNNVIKRASTKACASRAPRLCSRFRRRWQRLAEARSRRRVAPLYNAGVPRVVAFYALLGWVIWRLAQALSLKHYERNKLHVARARQYRRWLVE